MSETLASLEPVYYRVVDDPETGACGFVVIDELIRGRGTGGLRCTANVSLDEVARLAHEMTLKFAFLNLPSGGAKAGLAIPDEMPKDLRLRACFNFGAGIADLVQSKKYISGLDLGTTPEDLDSLLAGAGVRPERPPVIKDMDSNYFTALTVFAAAEALLEVRGRSFNGTTVLLEGVGKVGSHLVRMLKAAGAQLLGISTREGSVYDAAGIDSDYLLDAKARYGDALVNRFEGLQPEAPEALFEKKADLLIPGGGADSINASNVEKIEVRWIVPIANICADQVIEQRLHERGIDFVPGFVSNIGGIFCWYLTRLPAFAREEFIRVGFKSKVSQLIRLADETNCAVAQTARRLSQDNLDRLKKLNSGSLTARVSSVMHNLSPKRLGYILGSRIFGSSWERRWNRVNKAYYTSRFFG